MAYRATNFESVCLDTNAQHLLAISETDPAELIFSETLFGPTTPVLRSHGHTSVS